MNPLSRAKPRLQIGIIGAAADLGYTKRLENLAQALGYFIAQSGSILVVGSEKDSDSLSSAACRGARRVSGSSVVGVTYGRGLRVWDSADIVIATGMERGGGREFVLVNSCDAIIALNGGSGTLTEIAMAYQADIPVVALGRSGGWSAKLSGRYLDGRKRRKIIPAATPRQAVASALELARQRRARMREVLLLTSTHGNEPIGTDVLSAIDPSGQSFACGWMIGNERAARRRVRFVESDLNRSGPDLSSVDTYEQRRAGEILAATRSYRYVIDIHGTDAPTGIFIIISNPIPENFRLAAALPIRNVVVWASGSKLQRGPLTQFVRAGLEIECGPQKSPSVRRQLRQILEPIARRGQDALNNTTQRQDYYRVFGRLRTSDLPKGKVLMKDFTRTRVNGETFYPLLVGRYQDIVCYKMERLDFWSRFSYSPQTAKTSAFGAHRRSF